eukprot:6172632-Pleurochrysis_carterae.AAC.1
MRTHAAWREVPPSAPRCNALEPCSASACTFARARSKWATQAASPAAAAKWIAVRSGECWWPQGAFTFAPLTDASLRKRARLPSEAAVPSERWMMC